MAKKAQVIQLQTEVNNDEDWEKLMQRDGLIVIDIYSEWCGPCSGMTATLKKLKLEIGGDLLQLAIAKSDKITALERFRNKSEPTWMFIVNGKMVNFMFGANAPKLTRLIIEELKKETDAREGRRERVLHDIEELTEEERERQEVIENQLREAREKELAKAAKELYERRIAECHNILETLNHYGIILIFHHAKTGYQEAFGDLLGEAGLTISQTEKIDITMEQLQELFFFGINPFPEESVEELLNEQSLVLLVKPIPSRDVTEPTDDLILEVVYGPSKRPPGGHDSPAQLLSHVPQTDEEGEPLEPLEMVGLWVPENELEKATALRLFFPKITEHHLIPEPEPTPPHYAVVFDALRRQDVLNLMEKYPNEIIRFGFFTSEVPENAKLIAKNLKKYERHQIKTPTPDAKLVIQLSKKKSECVLAFVQMKPQYISSNAKEGERECKIFFPDGYDEPPEKMEEEEKEKPKKKKKKTAATAVTDEGVRSIRSPAQSLILGQSRTLSEIGGSARQLVTGITTAEDEEDEEDVYPGESEMKVVAKRSSGEIVPASRQPSLIPSQLGSVIAIESQHPSVIAPEFLQSQPLREPASQHPSIAAVVPSEGAPAEAAAPDSVPAEAGQEATPTTEVGQSPPESPEESSPPESPTTEPTTDVTATTDEESPA